MSGTTPVLVIQGPNMTYLGRRLPEYYGRTTAAELDVMIEAEAARLGLAPEILYTHHEGVAIERVYAAVEAGVRGLLMNPAGFLYAGWALRDTLEAVREAEGFVYVEVHMTNVEKRGKHSVLADQADGFIAGLGTDSYMLGLRALAGLLAVKSAPG